MMPVAIPCSTRPRMSIPKSADSAHTTAPRMNAAFAITASWRVLSQRETSPNSGSTTPTASRYAVVNHCTIAADTLNTSMRSGRAMLSAASLNSPRNPAISSPISEMNGERACGRVSLMHNPFVGVSRHVFGVTSWWAVGRPVTGRP